MSARDLRKISCVLVQKNERVITGFGDELLVKHYVEYKVSTILDQARIWQMFQRAPWKWRMETSGGDERLGSAVQELQAPDMSGPNIVCVKSTGTG